MLTEELAAVHASPRHLGGVTQKRSNDRRVSWWNGWHGICREFHAFTFVFNGELEKPLHDPSRELASGFGFAFGRSFTRKVAAMIELRTESSIDFQRDRLVLVNAGIIDGMRNVVVYANIGHSVFSDDGGHFYAGGGFKVVIGR